MHIISSQMEHTDTCTSYMTLYIHVTVKEKKNPQKLLVRFFFSVSLYVHAFRIKIYFFLISSRLILSRHVENQKRGFVRLCPDLPLW